MIRRFKMKKLLSIALAFCLAMGVCMGFSANVKHAKADAVEDVQALLLDYFNGGYYVKDTQFINVDNSASNFHAGANQLVRRTEYTPGRLYMSNSEGTINSGYKDVGTNMAHFKINKDYEDKVDFTVKNTSVEKYFTDLKELASLAAAGSWEASLDDKGIQQYTMSIKVIDKVQDWQWVHFIAPMWIGSTNALTQVVIKETSALILELWSNSTEFARAEIKKMTELVGNEAHNFTKKDKVSEFYTIYGNLASDKGSVEYNGETLTQCLKMEGSTEITFTAPAGTLTLVFGGNVTASGQKVLVDGESYNVGKDGVAEIPLEAGTHIITKSASINLFYMLYNYEGCTVHTPGEVATCLTHQVCTTCGLVLEKPFGHSGGKATCEAQANCETCGVAYGKLGAHEDTIGDGRCDVCGLNLSLLKVHDFTESGIESTLFTIIGSLSTSKGTVDYLGRELTQCLKMEDATSISFTTTSAATITLVFGEAETYKKVKIDGDTYYTDGNAMVSVDLVKGDHTIKKGDSINLFYITILSTCTEHIPGEEATCQNAQTCTECGEVIVKKLDHTGGTATCQAQAKCSDCGEAYGELGDHTGGTATCEAPAKCETCGVDYGELGDHVDANSDNACDVCGYSWATQEPGQGGSEILVFSEVRSINKNTVVYGDDDAGFIVTTGNYSSSIMELEISKDGKSFSHVLLTGSNKKALNIKANKSGVMTVYFTVIDGNLDPKEGKVTFGTETCTTDTSGVWYSLKINVTAGQTYTLVTDANRLVLCGVEFTPAE